MPSQNTFADIPNNTASSWWRDPGLRINVLFCAGLCLCPYYLGFDSSLLTGLQALPQWTKYFGNPTGTKLGGIVACLSLPSVISSFLSDFIARSYGRRYALWTGAVLMIIGAFVNAFSTSVGMYVGSRIILGFGGGMTKVVAPPLLQETAHPRLRPILASMYYALYYAGSILAAWLTFGTLHMGSTDWSWRLPSLFQVLGPILVLAITAWMPESPRFMVKQGKVDQALEVLAKYHANGDLNDPLVRYEHQEIVAAIQAEENNKNVSYADFFRTSANRHRLAVLVGISLGQNWIGNGIISYYLSPILKTVGITDATQVVGINGGLQIWNLIMALGGAFSVERLGRRPLWLVSTAGMMVSNAIIMGLSAGFTETNNHAIGVAVIPFLYIFYGFYDIAWTPLAYSYSSEILPYEMRTKGMAIFVAVQNIGQAFNQFVNPIALAAMAWKYYGIYLVIEAFYLVFIWFGFPETRHRTIEEVSVLFDHRAAARKSKSGGAGSATGTGGLDFQAQALAALDKDRKHHVEDTEHNEHKV